MTLHRATLPLLLAAAAVAVPTAAQNPTLVPAALQNVTPFGVVRGRKVTLTLSGVNIQRATRAVFDDPAITGTVVPGANANQAKVEAEIGAAARTGVHSVSLHTPLGTTGAVTFAVGAWPEIAAKEPDASSAGGAVQSLPTTFTGALETPGDEDTFRFQAAAGEELVFEVIAGQIRSRLSALLTLTDAGGAVLAESGSMEGRQDPVLTHRFEKAGTYAIRIRDLENASGGNVYYRLNVGAFPFIRSVFPLGFRKGEGEVALRGVNLPAGKARLSAAEAGWGAAVSLSEVGGKPLLRHVRVGVGAEPEVLETDAPHDTPVGAQRVEWPVTVNGRITETGGGDFYRFHARKGQTVLLEVQARRLGSPLDSVFEVLDGQGKRIERAALRCLSETALTLRDHDSAVTGLRLLTWNDLAIGDYLYVRGEVVRILGLPKGPDEDTRFRNFRGQRLAFLETTPTAHANNTPIYKVRVHPPGSQFPPNGMPVFRLYYRNDDGGPLYGKDSRLTFTAPADGEYVVRIADVRGEGSDEHAYRLTLREPRPDYRLSLAMEHPSIPAGSRIPVEVTAERLDGMEEEIRVRLEGLPPGYTATPGVIEAGETSATLLLSASVDAPPPAQPSRLELLGEATLGGRTLERRTAPAGGAAVVTALPKADLTVRTDRPRLVIRPGQEQSIEASITRENGFAGRVPIELRNLPHGVRVLDVGLNGVLITEGETSRRFTIYCEPWVKPMLRTVYCTVRTETGSPAPTEVAAEPILLEVAPASQARR